MYILYGYENFAKTVGEKLTKQAVNIWYQQK